MVLSNASSKPPRAGDYQIEAKGFPVRTAFPWLLPDRSATRFFKDYK